jgi:hypothetical protein
MQKDTTEEILEPEIIQTEGRRAYDRSKRRLARDGHEDRQAPTGYVSWQSKINIDNGEINQEILDKYLSDYHYVELQSVSQLYPGSRIAYITNQNKWRSGGFFIRSELSEKKADGTPYEDGPHMYILYKSFNNAVFSVQVEDIEKLYTRQTNKIIVKKLITFKKPVKESNFPVKIMNINGNEVVIHYARDNYNRMLFLATKKYTTAKDDPESWSFDDGSQE